MESKPLTLFQRRLKIQEELKQPKKTESNPFFKNKYAGLESIWDELRPLLNEYEVLVNERTDVIASEGKVTEVLRMWLEGNGEKSEPTIGELKSKDVNDPQKTGSAITYARRYQLCLLFNIVPEADDDGNAAAGNNTTPTPVAQTPKVSTGSINDWPVKQGGFLQPRHL